MADEILTGIHPFWILAKTSPRRWLIGYNVSLQKNVGVGGGFLTRSGERKSITQTRVHVTASTAVFPTTQHAARSA